VAETYDMREAEALLAFAAAGAEAETVRAVYAGFEDMVRANMGEPLNDGQLQVLYDQHLPKLGPRLANYLRDWYVN
jgi:hypothetical protein